MYVIASYALLEVIELNSARLLRSDNTILLLQVHR